MPFTIYTKDGRVLSVHTEVGAGFARVVVEEQQPEQPAMEPQEDE